MDITRVEAELTALLRDEREAAGIEAQLTTIAAQIDEAARTATEAGAGLSSEQEDVRRLETFSATRIWAELGGQKDERLRRERAEVEAAAYRHTEARVRLEALRAAQRELQGRFAALGDLVGRRAQALAAREDFLSRFGGPVATELAQLAELTGSGQAELRELDEAVATAQLTLQALDRAAEQLASAGDWATYDTFFNGGLMTDMVKRDRLDRATRLLEQARSQMRTLRRELADVMGAGEQQPAGVVVNDLTGFLDVWFDNIFSDWAMRDRIADARENTRRALGQVQALTSRLSARRTALAERLDAAAARRAELLLDGVSG